MFSCCFVAIFILPSPFSRCNLFEWLLAYICYNLAMPGNFDKPIQPVSPRKMWDQLPFAGGFKRKNPDSFDASEPLMDVDCSEFTAGCSSKRLCTQQEWHQSDFRSSHNAILPATLYSHMVVGAGQNQPTGVPTTPQKIYQDVDDPLARPRDCMRERQNVFSHDHCRWYLTP
ncbi:uncharacterized protein LOC129595765 isoform X2 [Paramacrobiotus metropolitanus]|uniref:uncharacterized protein LOC129595765 isoform X2 n=1 Tax=Paramacrobiotus metropolitanus TaxID=2943436 RepID=UPI002445E155|nr:uncharacterized protein LOC129595765 isoform X2 [Paramacrobiotus metropolitanus]